MKQEEKNTYKEKGNTLSTESLSKDILSYIRHFNACRPAWAALPERPEIDIQKILTDKTEIEKFAGLLMSTHISEEDDMLLRFGLIPGIYSLIGMRIFGAPCLDEFEPHLASTVFRFIMYHSVEQSKGFERAIRAWHSIIYDDDDQEIADEFLMFLSGKPNHKELSSILKRIHSIANVMGNEGATA